MSLKITLLMINIYCNTDSLHTYIQTNLVNSKCLELEILFELSVCLFVYFVWFDPWRPSQPFSSYVRTGLPWLNYIVIHAWINVFCPRTQCSDAGEARTTTPQSRAKHSITESHCSPNEISEVRIIGSRLSNIYSSKVIIISSFFYT